VKAAEGRGRLAGLWTRGGIQHGEEEEGNVGEESRVPRWLAGWLPGERAVNRIPSLL